MWMSLKMIFHLHLGEVFLLLTTMIWIIKLVIENIFRDIMDKHCPKVEMRVTHPSSSAWRTDENKQLQNDRDRYYAKFKKMKKEKKEKKQT